MVNGFLSSLSPIILGYSRMICNASSGSSPFSRCGEILNKPMDIADARRMLLRLQGDVHAVYTGVALCHKGKRLDDLPDFVNFAVRTEVVFYPMEEAEIEQYLACGEYADKAGAYAIQGRMAAYIREINGDYYNVVGLPLSAIVQELKKIEGNA